MTMLEQWQAKKAQIEQALAEGRIDSEYALARLRHLDYRIKRRPRILKRRRDRNAWRKGRRASLPGWDNTVQHPVAE